MVILGGPQLVAFWPVGRAVGVLAASFGLFDAELEVVGPRELADAFALLAARYARAGTS